MNATAEVRAALERDHAEWGPWLTLLAEAQRSLDDPLWARAVPGAPPATDARDSPLLEGVVLRVDTRGTDRFVRGLLDVTGKRVASLAPLRAAARGDRLDAFALLGAAVCEDVAALDDQAAGLGLQPAVLRAVATVAAMPLLHACRSAWKDAPAPGWSHGYCPVCGAWATLAEARGLERTRRFRCARCGADWRADWLRCPYCDNIDHASLGSLVTETALESRKIEVCEVCRGYVKTLATLQATPADAVALLDLATVELDVAGLEHGYERPAEPAYAQHARVVEATP